MLRVLVGELLVGSGLLPLFSVAEVGLVQFEAQFGNAFVLRGFDVGDGPVLVDDKEITSSESRAFVPCAIDSLLTVSTVDCVNDDVFRERFLADGSSIDPALGERLVARDEDDLVGGFAFVPGEIAQCALDDSSAVFLPTICFEGE